MISIKDKNFKLEIERKPIKNIYLRVDGDTLKVTCNNRVPELEIINFINSKRNWIYRAATRKDNMTKLNVGETIYYLGKEYKLLVEMGNKYIRIDDDQIYIKCKDGSIESAVKVLYEYGKKRILDFVNEFQDKYHPVLQDYGYHKIPEYKVKHLTSMWGVCYSQKNLINLSDRLIHYDPICIEAVVWHELLHFIIPNHSKRFHDVLAMYMPEYEKIIKTLR